MKEKRIEQKEQKTGKSKKRIVISITSAVLVVAVILAFVFWPYFTEKNRVMANCNGIEIRENTYRMYVYDSMQDFMTTFEVDANTKNFWDVELDGKLPKTHIKENALQKLKLYAYYKAGCEASKISLSEEAHQNFISYYDEYYKDLDTVSEYGVERQYFLDFLYEQYLFQTYFLQEAQKLEVTEEEVLKAFDKNRTESARVTVKTVFLKAEKNNWEELKSKAYAIKEQIQKGTSIDTVIAAESDYRGNNQGEFVVVSTSSYSNTLGKEYNDAVLAGNAGEVTVLKTSTGYCINEIVKVEMKESAQKELTEVVQQEKYTEQVSAFLESDENYTVTITNQKVYDGISLPGFDADGESADSSER